MKKHNGKTYLEVVAVMSIDNVITNDREVISSLMDLGRVKKFIDRNDANLMEYFGVWDNPSQLPVLFYYHEATGDTISALDIKKEYKFDQTALTALELINKAKEILNTSEIYDTKSAAAVLRSRGHSVTVNSNPSMKYLFTDL